MKITYNFNELDNSKVETVGGKNASLGEMYQQLSSQGINIPDGFASSADAYWKFIRDNDIENSLKETLESLDNKDMDNLNEVGQKCRDIIMSVKIPKKISEGILQAYEELKEREEALTSVAVRSSATAEDLPEVSFAGQHESFMNIKSEEELLEAWKNCVASLFTDRAIKYREENGFDHMKIALSVGVQKMVRADKASAGVAFTLDPDSGFRNVILINGAWGLGENVVQGTVRTDEFFLYKKALKDNKKAIISKKPGTKKKMMVYAEKSNDETIVNKDTPKEKQKQLILQDDELSLLGKWCLSIEEHYEKPMDIEWAKDGVSNQLYIVQARPETVHSSKGKKSKLKKYSFKENGEKPIVKGVGIGDKIAAGKAKILESPEQADKVHEGDVLVTEITNPDWDTVMKKASAIITNSGGRTSHAAIVARELGAVAVVGTANATETIKDGQEITVSSAKGNEGVIYEGIMEWEEDEIDLEKLGNPETEVMMILANPGTAFQNAMYPVDGVGLLRLEFAINNAIKVHPMALLKFDEIEDKEVKKQIDNITYLYQDKREFFVDQLSMAVGTIAAAFYPNDVIVRMSDFKTNEYADLIGGQQFEIDEENPMVGFRGASRYYHDRYREGFELECEAMKVVRNEMGLTNVKLMIPFCRTIEEGKEVQKVMESKGLERGKDDLEIYVMVEIPSNVILAHQFADIFDGFSIGSNDLTQLTLGIDRDSELVSDLFNEKKEAVKRMISNVIQTAKQTKTKIGLCGQAPSDFPDFAKFLVKNKINSISFNPDAIAKGIENILVAEKQYDK